MATSSLPEKLLSFFGDFEWKNPFVLVAKIFLKQKSHYKSQNKRTKS